MFVLEQLDKAGKDGTSMAALVTAVESVLGLVDAHSRVNVELAEFEALGVLRVSKRSGATWVTLAISDKQLTDALADLTGLSDAELSEFQGHAGRATPSPTTGRSPSGMWRPRSMSASTAIVGAWTWAR